MQPQNATKKEVLQRDELLTREMVDRTVRPLRLEQIKKRQVLSETWEPRLRYAWDNGPAIGRYLAELKNGRIAARTCRKCDRIMVPPRMFCELCWRPTDRWVFVQDTGTVSTFVISHVDWKAGRLDIEGGQRPLTPAVITLDGASPDMGILHMLDEVDPDKIHIGMRVRAVWKPAADREGSITDIRHFKPLDAGRKRGK